MKKRGRPTVKEMMERMKKTLSYNNGRVGNIKELSETVKQSGIIAAEVETLEICYSELTELTDFSEFTNLKDLVLHDNKLSVISGLENLKKLESLHLERNGLVEMNGVSSLLNLEYLWLFYNEITQIEGLENLFRLYELNLGRNKITEIKGLDSLANLEILSLQGNKISVIQGLQNLNNLNKLSLESNLICKIEGLENLRELRNLNLDSNSIVKIEGLDNLPLLDNLSVSYNKIKKIEGLENLPNLKELGLGENSISQITGLDNLVSLRLLHLRKNQISEIQGLDNLKNLISLNLCYNTIKEIGGLNCLASLNSIDLSGNNISEIKGLDYLKRLKRLDLRSNKTISKIEGLDNLTDLEYLDISFNSISKIENLAHLVNLHHLSLEGNNISDIEGLDSLSTLTSLDLGRNNIRELKGLERLSGLDSMSLNDNPLGIQCLEKLVYYKQNRYLPNLTCVNLENTNIDWKDGRAAALAWYLQEMNVEIVANDVKPAPPDVKKRTVIDEIQDFLMKLPLTPLEVSVLKQILVEEFYLKKADEMSLDKRGFTGRGVLKSQKVAIKVDLDIRLQREHEFYRTVRNTEFRDFCPSLISEGEYRKFEGIGFLPLSNLDNELVPGFVKVNSNYGALLFRNHKPMFNSHGINYNLFLMSLFHKCASSFDESFKESLGLSVYADIEGNPHHLTVDNPGINKFGDAYDRFLRTRINDPKFVKIINDYNRMLTELHGQKVLAIIEGDWKPDNLYNGYKVDFSCVGHSLEVDDIAYYLSDSSLNVDFEKFKLLIGKYSEYRALHDQNFNRSFLENSESIAASAWLRQLVLRHSVMKKRDLMQHDKFAQREYYQRRINEILKGGAGRFL